MMQAKVRDPVDVEILQDIRERLSPDPAILIYQSMFEQIPNRIPEYYSQEQIDSIEYQIIQTLLFE